MGRDGPTTFGELLTLTVGGVLFTFLVSGASAVAELLVYPLEALAEAFTAAVEATVLAPAELLAAAPFSVLPVALAFVGVVYLCVTAAERQAGTGPVTGATLLPFMLRMLGAPAQLEHDEPDPFERATERYVTGELTEHELEVALAEAWAAELDVDLEDPAQLADPADPVTLDDLDAEADTGEAEA